jgi:hypothetical protein
MEGKIKRGYYIMTHIRDPVDAFCLERCINSIRLHDKNYNIVVVNDKSPLQDMFNKIKNAHANDQKIQFIVNTQYPGAGEIYPYWFNTQNRLFDVFVTLHDSMLLKRAIPGEVWEGHKCSFLWYFPKFQQMRHITDSLTNICENLSCGKQILNMYGQPNLWVGCFGSSMLIRQEFLDVLFSKYELDKLMNYIKNRTHRETCERIFGIIICSELGRDVVKNSSLNKNIFDYPKAYYIKNNHATLTYNEFVSKYKDYKGFMLKVWRGR